MTPPSCPAPAETAAVPDPPKSPKGRARYWDDTVQEAIAVLRRALAERGNRSNEALAMILDLEKTRMRHRSTISGTFVPCLPDLDDDWGQPLPSAFAEGYRAEKAAALAAAARATPPTVDRDTEGSADVGSFPSVSRPTEVVVAPAPAPPPPAPAPRRDPPKPAFPLPIHERLKLQKLQNGVVCHFHDHDDDSLMEAGWQRPADWEGPVPAGAAVGRPP